jgi:hypothetical protein
MANFMNPLFYPSVNANSENATNYIIPDMSLRYKLRVLMTQYSSQEIHATLQQIFRDDYEYYQTLFSQAQIHTQAESQTQTQAQVETQNQAQPQTQPQAQPQTQTQAQPQAQQESQPTPLTPTDETPISNTTKLRSDTRIRVVKRPVADAPTEETVTVVVQREDAVSVASVISGDREKKAQMKKEQTEKEGEKYRELVSKGIDPESLLTKENLKKWIDTDGLTYAQIARDHVGLSALQVSNIAKGFGFKSIIAKKRAMFLAAKKF